MHSFHRFLYFKLSEGYTATVSPSLQLGTLCKQLRYCWVGKSISCLFYWAKILPLSVQTVQEYKSSCPLNMSAADLLSRTKKAFEFHPSSQIRSQIASAAIFPFRLSLNFFFTISCSVAELYLIPAPKRGHFM